MSNVHLSMYGGQQGRKIENLDGNAINSVSWVQARQFNGFAATRTCDNCWRDYPPKNMGTYPTVKFVPHFLLLCRLALCHVRYLTGSWDWSFSCGLYTRIFETRSYLYRSDILSTYFHSLNCCIAITNLSLFSLTVASYYFLHWSVQDQPNFWSCLYFSPGSWKKDKLTPKGQRIDIVKNTHCKFSYCLMPSSKLLVSERSFFAKLWD